VSEEKGLVVLLTPRKKESLSWGKNPQQKQVPLGGEKSILSFGGHNRGGYRKSQQNKRAQESNISTIWSKQQNKKEGSEVEREEDLY